MGTAGILVALTLLTLAVNIPFGYLRSQSKKYSFKWILYIHLPVPLIIYLRHVTGINYYYIPLMLAAAMTGQFTGGGLFPNK